MLTQAEPLLDASQEPERACFLFLGGSVILRLFQQQGRPLWSAQITDNIEGIEIDGLYGRGSGCVYWVAKNDRIFIAISGIPSFKPRSFDLAELSSPLFSLTIIFSLSAVFTPFFSFFVLYHITPLIFNLFVPLLFCLCIVFLLLFSSLSILSPFSAVVQSTVVQFVLLLME